MMNEQQKKRFEAISRITYKDESDYGYPGGACVVIATCMAFPWVNVREIFAKYCVLNVSKFVNGEDLQGEIEENIVKFDGSDEMVTLEVLQEFEEENNIAYMKYSGLDQLTVDEFCKKHNSITAIVFVSGHAFAIINGEQIQHKVAEKYYRNKHITAAFFINPACMERDYEDEYDQPFVRSINDASYEYTDEKSTKKKKTRRKISSKNKPKRKKKPNKKK